MKILLIGAGLAALGVSAAAAGGVRELSAKASETLANYQPTGVVQDCVPLRQIDSIKVIEDRVILVEMNGGRVYLNQTPSACNATRGNRRLELRINEPNLCRGQIVDIVDNGSGFPVGSCSLGAFERVEEKPAQG